MLVIIFAQNEQPQSSSDDDLKTMFGKSTTMKLGWFVGIDPGYTQFDSRNAWLGGVSAGVILNHKINLQKFMRLNAGVSYRYAGDLQLINTPSTLMNNFTVTIGLKFGKF